MTNSTPVLSPRRKVQPASAAQVPIIICDDHAAIRAGIARILEEQKMAVIEGCDTVPALLTLVRQCPNAVVITDLAIDQLPFPALAAKLHSLSADCRIVVYSMREAPATIGLCYEAGALAFVPKSSEPEEIIKAVESACADQRYIPPSVAANLANFHIADRNSPMSMLSAQEKNMFAGYAKGETVEMLARRFGVSDKRVQNILSQISKKLDAPRSAFFQVARRYGLIDF